MIRKVRLAWFLPMSLATVLATMACASGFAAEPPGLNPTPTQPAAEITAAGFGSRPGPRRPIGSTPFLNYAPKPGVSAFMNLFRTDNFSDIDNYNLFVKPRLQQQQTNRRTRTELGSLRSRNELQGMQLRTLQRQVDILQGPSQPSDFENYHHYYPRLR